MKIQEGPPSSEHSLNSSMNERDLKTGLQFSSEEKKSVVDQINEKLRKSMSKHFKKVKLTKTNAKNSFYVDDLLRGDFHDPIYLAQKYPHLKNFKLYDNGKDPIRVHHEVEEFIENKRVLLKHREAALKRNILNL